MSNRLEIGTIEVNGVWRKPTPFETEHTVIGHLIKGEFYCTNCALRYTLIEPAAIAVYPVNILPYTQRCHDCCKLVVNGASDNASIF